MGVPTRARDIGVGERIAELPIAVGAELIEAYESVVSHPPNIHTSDARAADAALAAPVASGTLLIGFAVELLLPPVFGDAWARGGSLGLAFTRPLTAGDDVNLSAEVVAKLPHGDLTQIVLALRAQHADGTTVAAGSASARIA